MLAQADGVEQSSRVGNQTGGRVFLFLHTYDFWRDFNNYKSKGVVFIREPAEQSYGTVAVFKDLYGNLWDLLELKQRRPNSAPNHCSQAKYDIHLPCSRRSAVAAKCPEVEKLAALKAGFDVSDRIVSL